MARLNEYKKLEREFEKKVETLQRECPHKKTKWFVYWWAFAHSNGEVKVCLRCNKYVERRGTINEIKKQPNNKRSKIEKK